MRFGKTENNTLLKLLKCCLATLILGACITSSACQTDEENFDAQLKQCVLLGHKDINGGVGCLEKLLKSNPNQVIIYSFLADDYKQLGQIDKAEQAIEIFVRAYPLDASGRESFCEILMEKGDLNNAMAECTRALQSRPEDNFIRITAAQIQEKMGNMRFAEYIYKEALEVNPNDTNVLLYLGLFYERRERLDEAIKTLEKLIELKPENYKKVEEGIEKLKKKRELKQVKEKQLDKEIPKQPKPKEKPAEVK